jgi:hypothetical protein
MPDGLPVDLRADGLLWAINRVLLHPRGFALGVGVEDGQATGDLRLYGDGSEPWRYASENDNLSDAVDEDGLFAAFEALLARARNGDG